MHRVLLTLTLSLTTIGGFAGFTSAEPPPSVATAAAPAASLLGDWSGAIKLPGMDLRISAKFTGDPAKPSGTLDIPQQGARALPLDNISIDGDKVRFVLAGVPGAPTFDGRLEADRLAGSFSQGGGTFPFELTRGRAPGPNRPQNPVPPFPYTEEQVTVTRDDDTLAGTLTRPPGDGPFPAVILISGSGPQNRDEELFEHRPFAVLADHLSRAGIIVLRYDDRGVGESTGSQESADITSNALDAQAWVPFLKARKDVSAVGLLGHSEGGLLAPMVAVANDNVSFVIMLAGPGVTGMETLIEQNRALALSAGTSADDASKIADSARSLFESINDGASDDVLRDRVRALIAAQARGQEVPDSPEVAAMIDQQLRALRSPWFTEFLAHDPAHDLRTLKAPVLAIFGEKDVQVVPSQHAPAVQAALAEGNNPDATVKTLPGLNHLLQASRTGAVSEYAEIEETMNPEALDLIRDWINQRFGRK